MLIEPQYLRLCLDKAHYMTEQYRLYALGDGQAIPKDMNQFVRICREELGFNIKTHSVPLDAKASAIKGFFLLTDDAYEIYILQGLNTCWDAFVRCKELFHILLDSEEFRHLKIYDHLKEASLKMTAVSSVPSKPLVCEALAEIAAMEFLFPYRNRKFEKERASGAVNYFEIAKHYRIPRVYVEAYMSDDYMRMMGAFSSPD